MNAVSWQEVVVQTRLGQRSLVDETTRVDVSLPSASSCLQFRTGVDSKECVPGE